jgi:hypothetical protein
LPLKRCRAAPHAHARFHIEREGAGDAGRP